MNLSGKQTGHCQKTIRTILFLLIFIMLFSGCSKSQKNLGTAQKVETLSALPIMPTWASDNYMAPEWLLWPKADYSLPQNFYPWCGTVSHHQLTDKLIDTWFSEIKDRRDVENFFIICPSHFGLSCYDYSVAEVQWDCTNGKYVQSNLEITGEIKNALDVQADNQMFTVEHGASTLMPYIKKYFPEAKVVVVAVVTEAPMNVPYAQKLAEVIEPYFNSKEKRQKDFLLISTDFSHHGTPEVTEVRDSHSMIFLQKPALENYVAASCDNRVGMYALAYIRKDSTPAQILFHTNSWLLSGMDEDDVTSYFFTLME